MESNLQSSDKPDIELKLAGDLLEEMRAAKSLQVLESLWKRFLHHIDRVWNKAEAHYSKSPKWSSWGGKYLKQRRSDALLSYLVNARNVDEHSISEITEVRPGTFAIKARDASKGFYVNSFIIGDNGVKEVSLGENAVIDFKPSSVRLIAVRNRGREYLPPTTHLGEKVNPDDLIGVATKALQFYDDFLRAARNYFVSDAKSH